MYEPSMILTWLEENVQMRKSRRKALAAIAAGAMRLQGTGVLELGRAMEGPVKAKHCIKRVDRFLGNAQVEVDSVSSALFHQFRPTHGPVVVLADWTDRHPFQQLVLALPRDGRAIPFLCITVEKGDGSGAHDGLMIEAERLALELLATFCGKDITPIIIADRGFGNARWLATIAKWGWYFVQRLSCNHGVSVEEYVGSLSELGIRRGWKPKDWGWGTMNEEEWGPVRLISVYDRDADEPWYLVTNLKEQVPAEIVRLYKRRMWIEAMFRDLKNRSWGMGMAKTKLTTAARMDRHFIVIALAYVMLFAFGAAAESAGIADELKANTVKIRVLSLARIGNYFLQVLDTSIPCAIKQVLELPT